MKILHLSHTDEKSGAGIAAKRIHLSINNSKLNIKSILRVDRIFTKDEPSIIGIGIIKKILFL